MLTTSHDSSEKRTGLYSSPNDVFAFLSLKDLANDEETRHLSNMLGTELGERSQTEKISRQGQDRLLKEWQTDPDVAPME